MKFNPKTKSLEIKVGTLELVYHDLIYAIRSIRDMAGLPHDKYNRDNHVGLEPVDHAQRAILQACEHLGIVTDAEWGEQLDVRRE